MYSGSDQIHAIGPSEGTVAADMYSAGPHAVPSPEEENDYQTELEGQPSSIGGPLFFSTGQFSGYTTIRMELHEIQKANLGRKYARVDRRPLDPPPVIHLKIFEVQHAGTERETENELDYDDIQVLSLLCTVDLFPVPDSSIPSARDQAGVTDSSTGAHPFFFHSPSPSTSSTQALDDHYIHDTHNSETYSGRLAESHVRGGGPAGSVSSSSRMISAHAMHYSSYILPSRGTDAVHRLGDYSLTEDSKQTQALAGATFVQAVQVDYQGKKAILFVFSDLAVKIEGTFILRYRVFDLFSKPFPQNDEASITAETYGGPFRVYSTKEFPGLPASTELTKHLARWGVRLNIRETERKRRKRSKSDSPPVQTS